MFKYKQVIFKHPTVCLYMFTVNDAESTADILSDNVSACITYLFPAENNDFIITLLLNCSRLSSSKQHFNSIV